MVLGWFFGLRLFPASHHDAMRPDPAAGRSEQCGLCFTAPDFDLLHEVKMADVAQWEKGAADRVNGWPNALCSSTQIGNAPLMVRDAVYESSCLKLRSISNFCEALRQKGPTFMRFNGLHYEVSDGFKMVL